MEGNDDIKHIDRYAVSLQNFPESYPLHHVEGLCKINRHLILFPSFLCNLTKGKYNVNSASARAKATLGFWINIIHKMFYYSLENKVSQYLTAMEKCIIP